MSWDVFGNVLPRQISALFVSNAVATVTHHSSDSAPADTHVGRLYSLLLLPQAGRSIEGTRRTCGDKKKRPASPCHAAHVDFSGFRLILSLPLSMYSFESARVVNGLAQHLRQIHIICREHLARQIEDTSLEGSVHLVELLHQPMQDAPSMTGLPACESVATKLKT